MSEKSRFSGHLWRGLIAGTVVLVFPLVGTSHEFAHAAPSSISLDEPFTGATLNNPSKWISIAGGTLNPLEWPCLTAATTATSTSVGTVEACVNQNLNSAAANGSGALRLTRMRAFNNPNLSSGSIIYNEGLDASEGIDISFSISFANQMPGGSAGQVADGIGFFIKDGANATNEIGQAGGSMGYGMSHLANDLNSPNGGGLPGALLGIGFDKHGNFSWNGVGGRTCAQRGTHSNQGSPPSTAKNMLVLRGPDTSELQDGSAGFCYLSGTQVVFADAQFQRARVKIDPYLPGTATTVSVYLAPADDPTALPQAPVFTQSITISATTFKFGFSAATGWWSNNHDIRDLSVRNAGSAQWWPVASQSSSSSTGSGTGPTSGGTLLTINGTGINPTATVTIDGEPCTSVTVAGDGTSLTCLTPSRTLGTKQIVVTNPGGLPGYGTFTYVNPTPTVTAVNPSSGTPDGGNTVALTGTGFVDGATVTLGGQSCTNVVVVSSTELTCTAPAGTDGAVVDAVVTNIGNVSGTGAALYRYAIPSVSPSETSGTETAVTTTTTTTTVASPEVESVRVRQLPKTGWD
jgi:hypothetical protein